MTEPATIAAIVAVTVVTAVISVRGVRIARTPADFMVAARSVPSFLNASAISGEYLSAASFLGIAGLAMLEGLGALWYAVGYAAGYLVLLVAVAAPLRRFGAYTIPDFAEGRLESPLLRRAATGIVLLICGFYLLPQLKGAGLTLQVALGGPEWIGVVVLGVIVTLGIASGGMKGITFVQAFQYWLKITALAIPAIFLVMFLHHPPIGSIGSAAPHSFDQKTTIEFPASEQLTVGGTVRITGVGQVDGTARDGALTLTKGTHEVSAGTTLTFPAGARAPQVESSPIPSEKEWTSPLLHLGGEPIHPLAATYGILLATVLGAMGLPHILVRFYTNRDGQAARRTTAFVLLLLGCFYVFPAVFAVLGRLEAPGLYVSGQTDSVVLVLPRLASAGARRDRPRCPGGRGCVRRIPLDLVRPLHQHGRRRLARHHGQGCPELPRRRAGHRDRHDDARRLRRRHLHQRARRLGLRHRGVHLLSPPAARDLVAPIYLDRGARGPHSGRWRVVPGRDPHDGRGRQDGMAGRAPERAGHLDRPALVHRHGGPLTGHAQSAAERCGAEAAGPAPAGAGAAPLAAPPRTGAPPAAGHPRSRPIAPGGGVSRARA